VLRYSDTPFRLSPPVSGHYMKRAAIILAIVPTLALAGDFDSRVAAAKKVQATSDGLSYSARLAPLFEQAMQYCNPAGPYTKPDRILFTFVGKVTASGGLTSIDFTPRGRISRCFADRMANQQLPTPPDSLLTDKGVPIVYQASLAP